VGLVTKYQSCLNFAVLSLWGALSDERSGLSLVTPKRKNKRKNGFNVSVCVGCVVSLGRDHVLSNG
jgi:hypothetical protein